MRHLVRFLRQRLVVEQPRGFGIEPEIELIDPAEVEARPRQRVVAQLRGRVALGEIGGMRRDLVGDDAFPDVVTNSTNNTSSETSVATDPMIR